MNADDRVYLNTGHITAEAYERHPSAHRMTALYRFFDKHDVLLYVGITRTVPARLAQHCRKPWSWAAATVTLEWFPDIESATSAELAAIRTESPNYNLRGAR